MKSKLVKKNMTDVVREFVKFLGYFVVLSILSLMSVYFFYKSFASQQDKVQKEVLAYKEILNTQQELKSRLEIIYNRMDMINTGQARNDDLLINHLSKNIQEAKAIVSEDKSGDFKHYSFLLGKLDSILELKSDYIVISNKKRHALRDLEDCINNTKKIDKKIARYGRN